jgi:transposase
MRYIQGTDRDQTTLLPEVVDDYITEENPVRFIDAYVDGLDLADMDFTYSETKDTGRKPYNPADLLKLYIYGYLNKIRSSRQLEKATHRNIELIWLMRRLYPDFKTIADFRKDNKKSIKNVCRDFTLLCKKLDLFGCELIAIDGSKFSASNSNGRNFTKNKLEKLIKRIDDQIDAYLRDMDNVDRTEKDVKTPSVDDLKEKIEKLNKRREKYQGLKSQLEESGETQISLTDPDSRMMNTTGGKDVAYNVQIAVDSKHKLIVTHEVTNDCTDEQQLHPMAREAKEVLDVDSLDVLGDAGYWERQNIKKCQEDRICTYVPGPTKSHNKSLGLYTNADFLYDPQEDTYRCPAGEVLTQRGLRKRKKSGLTEKTYTTHACYSCPQKPKCTRSKTTRYIYRWVDEEVMELLKKRVQENKEKVELRKSLVEHPFGTIKHWMGHRYFLTRGIEKVSAEMSLSVLSYNLKRVLNIVDFKELMAAVS